MPEDEFELYLTLLAKTLRLKDDQRDAIAAELRDHMENRLRELMLQGIDREQAITTALAEFGDASALGHDLTHSNPQRIHSRRRIMQTTFGTLAACAAVTFSVMLLTPSNYKGAPNQSGAVAQDEGAAPSLDREKQLQTEIITLNGVLTEIRTREEQNKDVNTKLKEKLNGQTISIGFSDQPLSDCLAYIRNQVGINIVVNWAEFALHGGPKQDTPISLQLQDVTADIALDMLLRVVPQDTFADDRLAYSLCDGVVMISTKGNLMLGSPYIPTQVLGTQYIQQSSAATLAQAIAIQAQHSEDGTTTIVGHPAQPIDIASPLHGSLEYRPGVRVLEGKDRREALLNELRIVEEMLDEHRHLQERLKEEIVAYSEDLNLIAALRTQDASQVDEAAANNMELSKAELTLRHAAVAERALQLEKEAMAIEKELRLLAD